MGTEEDMAGMSESEGLNDTSTALSPGNGQTNRLWQCWVGIVDDGAVCAVPVLKLGHVAWGFRGMRWDTMKGTKNGRKGKECQIEMNNKNRKNNKGYSWDWRLSEGMIESSCLVWAQEVCVCVGGW